MKLNVEMNLVLINNYLVTPKKFMILEPNIKPFYHGGVYYRYGRHARNPKKILLKLFDFFKKRWKVFKNEY